jgi:GT2 family glycosyltransferase/glycosyltransferase involved in cell wall biosynthesis
MRWFLKLIIFPLLDALEPRVIVEVGVEVGAVTRPLLDWAREHGALVHCIDPDPNLNVDELAGEHGEQLRFHREKSLDVLAEIAAVDVALIDGDHNWHTVLNELRVLERGAVEDGRQPPLVLLHDTGWPYGRRDLYYDPQSIPAAHRQPHARMGIVPGQSELGVGVNEHLENAMLEGTPANGVLTAVEDFIAASEINWRSLSIPGLSGLTILYTEASREENPALRAALARLDTPEVLNAQCEAVELARIQSELKRAGLVRRLAETQLKQVMQRVDPEQLVKLHRRVRELEQSRRELEERLGEGEDASAQLRLLTAEFDRSGESVELANQSPSSDAGRSGIAPDARTVAELTELQIELELARAQSGRLRSALARARVDAEVAAAEREAMERRLARLALGREGSDVARQSAPASPESNAGEIEAGSSNVESSNPADVSSSPAAGERERDARRTFLERYLPVLEQALPDARGRDPLALPSPLEPSGRLVGDDHWSHSDHQAEGAPSVEVIVCVHDALEDLRLCLWSLTHKTSMPIRLIMVDDGSGPETREYLDAFASHRPNVILISREEPPHGYTLAANAGLKQSRADYVVLLNSDAVVSDGWLERIIARGESDERIGILGPLSNAASHQSVPRLRENGSWATNPPPGWLTVDGAAFALREGSQCVNASLPFLNGFCYTIKRAVIDAIGYLDEERFAEGYCEENDYSQRARDAGFELAVVDDAYVFHSKSRSYGAAGRQELARSSYEVFRAKHGAEQIDAAVAGMEADATLTPVRAAFAERTSSPEALTALLAGTARRPLSIAFILPGLPFGGSGGSHSVYQEVKGLRKLGISAHIALPHWDWERARGAYADAAEVFQTFGDHDELAAVTADADVISATHYKSVAMLRALRERRLDFLPAYYVQDYEPFFTAPHIAEEAIASYTAVPDMLLFAKSHWLCNIVAERHGLPVSKVEPSIDSELFRPMEDRRSDGPLRVAAMVRPRTERRQPYATITVLERLLHERADAVEVVTFGCYADELREIAPDAHVIAERHRGLLARESVAQLLRDSDVFLDMSIYQAFGRTALEAMACGCTVVVPAIGGVWEFLEDSGNGLAVDTLSSDEVFNTLVSLSEDEERLERLRQAARETASRYSVERAALSEYLVFEQAYRARFGDTPLAAAASLA